MEKIMEILKRLRPDVDFMRETELIDGGILNSFDMITLVAELSDAYDIDIEINDIVPESLNSAERIYQLVQGILAGQEAPQCRNIKDAQKWSEK